MEIERRQQAPRLQLSERFTRDRVADCSVDLGGSLIELVALDELDEAVELVGGVFVLVSLSGNSDSDLAWHVSDTLEPDVSVELGIDADILIYMRKNNDTMVTVDTIITK